MTLEQESTLPRARKRLVLKPETIRSLHLTESALRGLQHLSQHDCDPKAQIRDAD